MARYYRIEISGPTSAVFTNMVVGKPDPGAQLVEMDIVVTTFSTPGPGAFVRVWGVSLQQIGQASDFNNATITVFGGMQAGLPLASAAVQNNQQGVLVQGIIQQAFGNWLGTTQTLDFIITPLSTTQANPANIAFLWRKGDTLDTAIQMALSTAYPAIPSEINISEKLVATQTQGSVFETVVQFAQYLKTVSQSILTVDYPGVDIVISENRFLVFDSTTAAEPTKILFQDLIGQPTWLGINQVQFNTVMRADLSVGDFIQFPALSALQTTTTPQGFSQFRDKSVFQGVWTIRYVRHVGNSRAPNAQSWISTFQASASGSSDADNAANNTGA